MAHDFHLSRGSPGERLAPISAALWDAEIGRQDFKMISGRPVSGYI
jgi:hypothetical protein